MNREALTDWLGAYEDAWRNHDAEAVGQLFTENAEYHQTPFKIYQGREEIKAYWARVTPNHEDIEVTTELLGIDNSLGFSRFYAEYENPEELPSTAPEDTRIRLDGISIIRLEGNQCDRFQEWWHRDP